MGLEVLPPVNSSHFDFSIEDRADGKAAIRFGLGAVRMWTQSSGHDYGCSSGSAIL